MAVEMKVPSVGESVTEVTIASWVKKDGDYVEMDEIICELESDKATFELPAEAAGILRIVAQEEETLEIGALVCRIEESAEASPTAETPKVEEPAATTTAAPVAAASGSGEIIEVTVPSVGESITEVTLSSWVKKDGDTVEMDEIICELESDKATFELPSPSAGVIKIIAEEGAVIPVGDLVAKITAGAGASSTAPTPAAASPAAASAPSGGKDTYASGHPSPSAAKILSEKGIDATAVKGTGVDGRVTKEDAQNAQKAAPAKASPAPAAPAPAVSEGDRGQRREKMSSLRKTIAKRLVSVKNETAMLTTFNEVDMKPIMDLRKNYKEKFKDIHGIGLGFMSFFTKACSIALQEFPSINAYIDGNEIVFNDFADISIAVSAPKGLVVPVIRNAEKLSFAGIESEVMRLALKARDGKLTLPEMTGGTFTITNGGIFGSMLSTPIINAPQSAILGMHNIVERPVAINGQVEIRPIMYLALSYDHRTIDGKESVSFLVRLKQLLEDPMRMMLQV
ncbi:2-oxoglutarate dehydrogenase complex dihydrolipoyllysine-residue succinyltransferase [Arcticibacterium luteifluviistationis]|uniref:Dihydrolipoyllysine-residue succinyltransferase component of 2-oxoglutarate dehydrogenase complex n=1 Tax=Arcticibacterium luteifluviistationis TaxID=1784714 RepID=A0A2Z4GAB5_9BACT|nr:2-oxoglutarate dehydrogenase complex dihydrolipoyllysine-residue succinyltransferase [Arcticibacterium luteifluviistationis]AWV98147.1 dihydrolipoamide succinyltransferase [Arcticibacterium luteifluviistationis]